jgi:uncharacterized protein (TIGR03085 family)
VQDGAIQEELVTSNALARAERTALAELMLEVGPDAPTLCTGWTARDLAAHIIVRESRPEAAGLVIPALHGRLEQVQAQVAQRPYPDLVESVRTGPPWWNPQRIGFVEAVSNTIEFFVHHEDVRRAQDGWEPRVLTDEQAAQLWAVVPTTVKAIAQRSPVGVTARPTDGPTAGTDTVLRSRTPGVTLVGPLGEIVLAVYGRETRGLEVQGDAAAVRAFAEYSR